MAAAAPKLTPLCQTITSHAWNANQTKIAVCPNNNEIHIYGVPNPNDTSTWILEQILKEHDQLVTAIDWSPKTNRILSCSQDRNAYVWTETSDGYWKPTLVLLRINRAATCCKWSPDGNKFAVGSGAKLVSVCYFEKENDWWVSKMIKKHKSTVLSVAWHPTNNSILATASSDFKCRIFSAYIKGVDAKDEIDQPFGTPLIEFSANGWVHDVAWSPSGSTLAFVSHDSAITFVDVNNGYAQQKITTQDLPYRAIAFLSDNSVVAAGHDFTPVAFSKAGANWVNNGRVDVQDKKTTGATSGVKGAFARFQAVDKVGTAAKDFSLSTKHQNTINTIQVTKRTGANATAFSTSGLDGRVLIWNVADITKTCPSFKQ